MATHQGDFIALFLIVARAGYQNNINLSTFDMSLFSTGIGTREQGELEPNWSEFMGGRALHLFWLVAIIFILLSKYSVNLLKQ